MALWVSIWSQVMYRYYISWLYITCDWLSNKILLKIFTINHLWPKLRLLSITSKISGEDCVIIGGHWLILHFLLQYEVELCNTASQLFRIKHQMNWITYKHHHMLMGHVGDCLIKELIWLSIKGTNVMLEQS